MPTHARVRAFLENVAKRQTPITYQELTRALQILPPHSIQNRCLCRILALTTSTRSPDCHSPPFCNSLETIRTSVSRSVTSKSNSSPNSEAVALSCCIKVEKSAAS
jgi:hypothetical protein